MTGNLIKRACPLLYLRQDTNITLATLAVTGWAGAYGRFSAVPIGAAGTRPTYNPTGGPNGLGCVTADGVDDGLSVANIVIAQPVWWVITCKWNTVYAANSTMFDCGTGNKNRLYRSGAVSLVLNAGTDLGSVATTTTAWGVYVLRFNGASSSGTKNGASIIAAGNAGAGGGTGATLFQFGGGGDFCAGSIAECLILPGRTPALWVTEIAATTKARMNL